MTAILAVDGVSKRFGGLQAIADVSFSLAAGEIVGLIGPNGAGKTTLFNLLVGLERPDAGTITLDGSAVAAEAAQDRGRGMTKTFQNVALFSEMSVLDNVLTAGLLRHSVADARDLARRCLERVGLRDVRRNPRGSCPSRSARGWSLPAPCAPSPRSCSSTRSWPPSTPPRWPAFSGSFAACATRPA